MKKIMSLVLACLMLLCALAAHAEVLSEWGLDEESAADLIQKGAATQTAGDVVVTIDEAAYDGVTAYIHYTLKDNAATKPLGTLDSDTGRYLLSGDSYAYFADKRIGWWHDGILINGQEYAMPLAGGLCFGSAENGLQEYFLTLRLDQAGVGYGEAETLGLPIGDPESENGGYLTVAFDKGIKDRLSISAQDVSVPLGTTTVTRVETVLTPIRAYVSLTLKPEGDAVDTDWADNAVLTDKSGSIIEGMMQGFSGAVAVGSNKALFELHTISNAPDEIYLALTSEDGKPDMDRAVRIR